MGVTLDSGALIAFERGDPRTRRALDAFARRGAVATVPAVVVAEAWRDRRRQVDLVRLLARTEVEPVDRDLAERSGELMRRAGTSDAVDAIVACSAARRGDMILTSDAADLQRLADDLGIIRIVTV